MYSPFRHVSEIFWKRRPIHFTFFITRRCNSRCPFCFYLRSKDSPDSGEELQISEIRTVSRSLGKLLWLAFSGGEIYLREDLADVSRIFYENNKPSVILLPTNGLLPGLIRERTEEILRHCRKSIIVVKLSLDGLNGTHDSIRNTPGSFKSTMETYRLLSGLLKKYQHFELGINTVLCSANQDTIGDIIKFVRGLGSVKTHTVSLIRGNLADKGLMTVEKDKYVKALDMLEENLVSGKGSTYRFRGARIKAAQDILQRRMILQTMLTGRGSIPCYAGILNLVMSETGDIYPCEMLPSSLGNVRDFSCDVKKLLRSGKAKEVIRSIREKSCACTHECTMMTNILFNPRCYPQLLREYIRIRAS